MSDAGTMYANAKALHELLQESRAENAELRKERDALDHLTDVLNATNDGLLAENDKLREELESVGTAAYLYGRGDLLAENEKLRELVRDALTTISWCTIDCYPSDNKKCELNERARELGVEV